MQHFGKLIFVFFLYRVYVVDWIVADLYDRIIEIAAKNLSHLVKGEVFENIVDMKTGYRINH